jgi:hypothetical protein
MLALAGFTAGDRDGAELGEEDDDGAEAPDNEAVIIYIILWL